jgi:hypothetical protein
MSWRLLLATLAFIGATLLLQPLYAADPAAGAKKDTAQAADEAKPEVKAAKFLRLARDKEGELISMDTAIVRYLPKEGAEGPTVDLIGAVHFAEKDYYEALNKQFEQYDVLLYELVAPEGKQTPKRGQTGNHPLAMVQNGMKDILELEHQLEHIDYRKPNMVHADMTPEAFSKKMAERNESFFQILMKSLGQGIAQRGQKQNQAADSGLGMMVIWFSPHRATLLRKLMAEQFEDLENSMKFLDGPGGSTIITERNKVALDVLKKQVESGKRKVGIFYGAGHMPDFERRLIDDFGLQRDEERWLIAWDLTHKPRGGTPTKGEKPVSSPNSSADGSNQPSSGPSKNR